MYTLVARLRVKQGAREAFLDAVRENAAATLRDEPGCLRFDVVQDAGDPDRFWFYEIYRDEEAFAVHRTTQHFARWREAAKACLAQGDGQVNHFGTVVAPACGAGATEAAVLRARGAPRTDRGGGVQTTYLATRAVGAAELLNGITELEPGAEVPWHSHNCEESVVVLEGVAGFECGESTVELAADDATWVPAAVAHRFVNRGPGLLRILWTYGRGDATRTWADGGETVLIEAPGR